MIEGQSASGEIKTNLPYVAAAEEAELVRRAQSGDHGAFGQLVSHVHKQLLRTTRSITRNLEDAEDAVQSAYVKAFEKLEYFKGESSFYTWITRIAVNESLTMLRSRKRRNQVSLSAPISEDGDVFFDVPDTRPDPEHAVAEGQRNHMLHRAVMRLIPSARTAVRARYLLGLSETETALAMGTSVGAVKALTYRGKLRLRMQLAAAV